MSNALLRRGPGSAARAFRAFSSTPSAADYARMQLIGRIVDTPEEISPAGGGREYLRYSIAVNSNSPKNPTASFYRVTSFAEGNSKTYIAGLQKGYVSIGRGYEIGTDDECRTLVAVEADVTMRASQDAEGNPRTRLSIIQRE